MSVTDSKTPVPVVDSTSTPDPPGGKDVDKQDKSQSEGTGAEEAPKPKPKKVAIYRGDCIYDSETRLFKIVDTTERTSKVSIDYVITLQREFNCKNEWTSTDIYVYGKGHLRDALLDIFDGAECLSLNEIPQKLDIKLLYHARNGLQQRLDDARKVTKNPNEDLVLELEAGLQLLKEELAGTSVSIQSLLNNGEITFNTLWAIFPPGELLFSLDELSEPCVSQFVTAINVKKHGVLDHKDIVASHFDDNGEMFGIAIPRRDLEQFPWDGSRKITDLEVFPLRYHPEVAAIRKKLLERGRKRLMLRDRKFNDYAGIGLYEQTLASGVSIFVKFSVQGRVVIDHLTFRKLEPNNHLMPNITDARPREQLTEDQIMTFPAVMYGFSLAEKFWGAFSVDCIHEITWNAMIFDQLVLPEKVKYLTRTLIKSHVNKSATFDDFVVEKGKGLIGLLTGPPGVGKTLTAEAVAELVQRPLYMLSSGELGAESSRLENKLKTILQMCKAWDAVLLLDEADVFLTKRDDYNLNHNAIVSIFLRNIEYYQGILLLTTNRADSIDAAFQSRIHFCHNYPDLSNDARKQIWQSFLNLAKANPDLKIDTFSEANLDTLGALAMNGRQIKNCMKMAQSIALEEEQSLTLDGIRMVAHSLQDFSFEEKV